MTTYTDSFQRANAADLGANWTEWTVTNQGGLEISNDTAVANGSGITDQKWYGAYWSANTVGDDQFSQFTVAALPTGNDWLGAAVRLGTVDKTQGYLTILFNGNVYLFALNGTTTPPVLGNIGVSWHVGDTLAVQAIGSTITALYNGTAIITATDTTWASGQPGLVIENFGDSNPAFASWEGGDGTPGGGGGGGGGNPSITTTSLPDAAQNLAYSETLTATGGTAPYTWSVSEGSPPTGLSLSSGGVISGTPTVTGVSDEFTVKVTDAASNTATMALSISVAVIAVSETGTSGGITSYSTLSALNNTGGADAQTMRLLQPTSPASGQPHAFLYTLPVEPSQGTTFGDPLATIQAGGLHNTYNVTVIEPSFPIDPWYADNPDDASTQQESFMLALRTWVAANLATSGSELHYLIGFSKSGVGGQQLLLRHPSLFAAVASWDFPADQTFGTFGADSAAVYGDATNFDDHYELTSGNITGWIAGTNLTTVDRIWIGAGFSFDGDVSDYDALLTSLGIEHFYSSVAASEHNWAPDPQWVPFALAAIIPQGGSPTVSLLTLTPITLTAGAGSPEDLTTALAGSALGSNTGILFPNTGHEVVYVQTNTGAGGTTVTTDIGTTIQGQTVPGIEVTEAASTIDMYGPFPSQFNKQDGSGDIEIDFGTPANVSAVIVVRQPGVA